MKVFNLFFIFLLLPLISFTQTCLPDRVDFETQGQIDSFLINFPGCTHILGDVYIDGTISSLDGLDVITQIDGDLSIRNNDQLLAINGLDNLLYVGGDMEIGDNNNLLYIDGFNNLREVGGYLLFYDNLSLLSINGFYNLDHIGDYLDFFDNEILVEIGGFQNLQTITGLLEFDNNFKMEAITGFQNLHTIGGYFVIEKSDSLRDISGLRSLRTIGGSFRISQNDVLSNLDPLNSLSSIGTTLRIFANDQLKDCAINILCSNTNIGGAIDIFSNGAGCMDMSQITASCQEGISGYVFYDYNENQIFDSTEYGIGDMNIIFGPENDQIFTNSDGRYFNTCAEGTTYTISLNEHPDWNLSTNTSQYEVLYQNGNSENFQNNFGLTPNFSRHDLSIRQYSSITRCNTEAIFSIDIQNTGTFIESNGTIVAHFNELMNYVAAQPEPTNIDLANRQITWSYADLYPWQTQHIDLTFEMPDETNTGANLNLETSVFRDSMGTSILAKQNTFNTIVRCSYDPNDKLVQPAGEQEENYTPKDSLLNYTIRFQNTGNDYAWDIEIQDTLDTDLDWSTFRVTQVSHPVQTKLSSDGSISFLFENIYLPDSTTDFAGSQGFIQYSIRPKANLPDFTIIENTAFIYFDFNPAIITNTTINTLVDEIPVSTYDIIEDASAYFNLWPNPANTFIAIEISRPLSGEEYLIEMINANGQLMSSNKIINVKQISVENLPKGIYFIKLKSARTNALLQSQRLLIL